MITMVVALMVAMVMAGMVTMVMAGMSIVFRGGFGLRCIRPVGFLLTSAQHKPGGNKHGNRNGTQTLHW
jgi:hypothetical protein